MRPEEVKDLLDDVRKGEKSPDEALAQLRRLPIDDLGFARLDTHRELRQGLPEAIYAEGKSPQQVVTIAQRLVESTTAPVLATRASDATASVLKSNFSEATYDPISRIVVVRREKARLAGSVAVISAGTSDIPVAREAGVTTDALGLTTTSLDDVGVAGLHRILNSQELLLAADIVIVVAGMEGALASLVGGITPAPVIAVPTSVGYGASFDGLAALLAMLNSCAAGVAVTNIDNGFGAAVFALRLIRSRSR
ncbi:MAG: nickel pincer cofactor biosynthesis protein LarB [Actinomycetota bacterium]|nr:nickel pincer cofactor biosynthesis protein LarB [Actinomycetota bacterium]